MTSFELFIAGRYLRAHRKEAVISVITAISVLGVAAGVMALVVALAVTNGFRNTLQRNLLGAMAHINVVPRTPGDGIENWPDLVARIRKVPHVTAVSPALYSPTFLSGPLQSKGAFIKGVDVASELALSGTLRRLKAGDLERLRDTSANPPGILLGTRMAEDLGMRVGDNVELLTDEMLPVGVRPVKRRFKVSGLFETGFFEIDDNWAYLSLPAAQKALSVDQINQIELNVDDLNNAAKIAKDVEKVAGERFTTTTWMERNKQLLGALKMERLVTIIVIGLIELVAALNIFITLVMMVMEKYRDIAVLMSMGARQEQIRRIFMLQGVLIGIVGIGDRTGGGPCVVLLRGEIPVDSAGGSGLLDELRAVRSAMGGRLLDCGAGGAGEFSGYAVPGEECHEDSAGGSLALRVRLILGALRVIRWGRLEADGLSNPPQVANLPPQVRSAYEDSQTIRADSGGRSCRAGAGRGQRCMEQSGNAEAWDADRDYPIGHETGGGPFRGLHGLGNQYPHGSRHELAEGRCRARVPPSARQPADSDCGGRSDWRGWRRDSESHGRNAISQ